MKKFDSSKKRAIFQPLTIQAGDSVFQLHPLWLLLLNLVFLFFVYGLFRRAHYDGDAYLQLYQASEQPWNCLKGGRPVAALFIWTLQSLGFHFIRNQVVGTFALMGCMGLTATLLSVRICRSQASVTPLKLVAADAAMLLAFANPMITEWFSVTSAGTFIGLAFLLMGLGVLAAVRKHGWSWWSLGALLLVNAADNIYQIYFEYFVIFALMLTVMEHGFRFNKKLMGEVIRILLIGAASAVLNVLLSRVINSLIVETSYRASSFRSEVLLDNLKNIWYEQRINLKCFFDFLPEYLVLGYSVLMGFFLLTALVQKRFRVWDLLCMAILCIGCYALLYAPHMISVPQLISQRTLIAWFALLSMMSVWAVFAVEGKLIIRAAVASVALMLIYCSYITIQLGENFLIRDALDRAYIHQIQQQIEKYEQASGEEIRYISFEPDASPQTYDAYMPKAELMMYYPVMALDADIFALNFITGRSLVKVDTPPGVYETYFAGRDWDRFLPEEQMIFIGETLYMAVY